MTVKVNSLTRIRQVLEKMPGANNKVKVIDAWRQAFEMNDRVKGSNKILVIGKVLQKIVLFNEELETAEKQIQERSEDGIISQEAFHPIFSRIREVLLTEDLLVKETQGKPIPNDQLGVLYMGAQLLDHEEDDIGKELESLRQEILAFWNKIKSKSLSQEVKKYVFEQLSHLLTAIEDYQIVGIKAFKNNSPNFYSSAIKNAELVKNDKATKDLTKDIGKLWKKAITFAETAQKSVSKVKGYLGTVDDIREIGESVSEFLK